ncbi:restriction endonuclease subunit S [Campylobacter jejuni]|nr:restriction endonuclease subunit S [Campylobacter jejuni]EAH4653924.1 restriction endonuclease subunit S [Campylobacter jejuni]EAH9243326.1 restriction endonuclease subunit S [Campylobacter jejuni]EAI7043020.1 restriction endonuclease subunit S [Campylobacter jejuni]EAI7863585.1 restriction endonuclease subunit S [Campylobacter jejuni]
MMNYWEVKKLGDIAEISSGGTPSRNKKEYWENGIIPWVKIKDIKENFISTTKEFITENGLKNSLVKLFKKGTLFYSILAICVLIIFFTFIMSKYYSQQAIESYKEIMMENDICQNLQK